MQAGDTLGVARLLELRRYTDAESSARTLLASDPESVTLNQMLASALDGQGRSQEAVLAARRACRLAPSDPTCLIVLSSAAIGAGDAALAHQAATAAVAAQPTSSSAHYTLARAHLAGGSVTDALEVAGRTVKLAPTWADAHNLHGMCLARVGLRREAREAYRQAIRLEPGHALALNNLAAMDARRNPLRATRGLTAAAGMDPQARIIQRNFAVVTHNFVVQLRWVVIGGGLLEIALAYGGTPWLLRGAALVATGALVVAAVWNFVRSLPRGVRRSPQRLVSELPDRTLLGIVYLALAGVFAVAVAFGDPETRDWGTQWLAQMAIVGVIWIAVRSARRRNPGDGR